MSTATLNPPSSAVRTTAGKYLTFVLGRESYGIPVLKVREIIRLVDITSVPQMPPYVKGVINLRGKIVPVLDLRLKFGLGDATTTERTCIVVVLVKGATGGESLMGVIVDAVEEVANIPAGDIEDAPDFGAALDTECFLGMAKVKGNVKALLDIDQVLGREAAQACASPAMRARS